MKTKTAEANMEAELYELVSLGNGLGTSSYLQSHVTG